MLCGWFETEERLGGAHLRFLIDYILETGVDPADPRRLFRILVGAYGVALLDGHRNRYRDKPRSGKTAEASFGQRNTCLGLVP